MLAKLLDYLKAALEVGGADAVAAAAKAARLLRWFDPGLAAKLAGYATDTRDYLKLAIAVLEAAIGEFGPPRVGVASTSSLAALAHEADQELKALGVLDSPVPVTLVNVALTPGDIALILEGIKLIGRFLKDRKDKKRAEEPS